MQYVSDNLWNTGEFIEIATIDYADTFRLLKNKLLEKEDSGVVNDPIINLCMAFLSSSWLSVEEYNKLSLDDLNKASDILVSLLNILEKHTDYRDVNLENVPKTLHKFFTVGKNIEFYNMLSACKPIKKSERKKSSRSKMLF